MVESKRRKEKRVEENLFPLTNTACYIRLEEGNVQVQRTSHSRRVVAEANLNPDVISEFVG